MPRFKIALGETSALKALQTVIVRALERHLRALSAIVHEVARGV
jgi:hypothetical protein